MTSLPSVAPQLAVWLWVMVMPQSRHGLAEALATVDGGRRADVADEFHDVLVVAAFEQRAHLLGGLAALQGEVGADVRGVQVSDASMRRSSRTTILPACLGLLQDLVPAGCFERGQDDHVDRRRRR